VPLYVLATPIGTLSDLSPRARDTLASADLIAAEDTRVTRKLLGLLQIPAPELVSYRGHTEARKALQLVERVAAGERVVLVSDAGTPAVSDPGQHLVRACLERTLPVHAIPGCSAVASAISVSGVPPAPFHFLAFGPRKPGPLRQWLRKYGALPGALVIFEAPGRVVNTLKALADVLPDRDVTLCRELSKMHEEIVLSNAADLAAELGARARLRGEVVLVVGPGEPPVVERQELQDGAGLKQVAAVLAERWGVTKRQAYQQLLALEQERAT
jgi:16S rRNA (cytidine1402-2'-O)-methyltransferase